MSKFIINVIDNDDAFYYLGNGEILFTSEDVKNYFTKEIENEEYSKHIGFWRSG